MLKIIVPLSGVLMLSMHGVGAAQESNVQEPAESEDFWSSWDGGKTEVAIERAEQDARNQLREDRREFDREWNRRAAALQKIEKAAERRRLARLREERAMQARQRAARAEQRGSPSIVEFADQVRALSYEMSKTPQQRQAEERQRQYNASMAAKRSAARRSARQSSSTSGSSRSGRSSQKSLRVQSSGNATCNPSVKPYEEWIYHQVIIEMCTVQWEHSDRNQNYEHRYVNYPVFRKFSELEVNSDAGARNIGDRIRARLRRVARQEITNRGGQYPGDARVSCGSQRKHFQTERQARNWADEVTDTRMNVQSTYAGNPVEVIWKQARNTVQGDELPDFEMRNLYEDMCKRSSAR